MPLDTLNGFPSLASDLRFEWNTSFDEVKHRLQERKARSLQEQGFRLLRFEETLTETPPIDFQYELHFSPDYEYGLRDVDAVMEVVGLKIDAQGTHRPLVEAYGRVLDMLTERYGEPHSNRGATREDLERMTHTLDKTRGHVSAMASWMGPKTLILHELVYTHTLKQRIRFSPIAEDIHIVNATGQAGLDLVVAFPGGKAKATLARGEDRTVEVPPGSDAHITVRLGDKEATCRVPDHRSSIRIQVKRRFFGGGLFFRE